MAAGPQTPVISAGRGRFRTLLLAAVAAVAAAPASADAIADFYKGKSLVFAVGTGAGGEYDLQARLLARHIVRHIPGNPQGVVQNMPGAGGAKMAAWLYNLAPKDGTQFGVIMNTFPASQAVGSVDLSFDVTQFHWIGAIGALTQTITAWTASGIRTLDDLKAQEYIAGASGRGAITYTMPAAMNALLGTRMKIVTGYQGGNDINLAMERGEAHVRSNSWSSWKTTRPDWIAEKKITVLAQGGRRAADLPNIPSLEELTTNPDDRKIMDLVVSGNHIGRPQAMPPGTPADRVAAMRTAFQATVKDPVFIAEVEKLRLELDPVSGEELQAYITRLQDVPKHLIPKAKEMLE
jgi:tripartite-type tricarboxylate transporter receptor subunit TctC